MASPEPAEVLELPRLVRGIPPAPPPALDPYLDAAARCFVRFGIRRTSVQDVAAAMGVNRTTVYRQVGTVESMVRLLTARELHRLLAHLGASVGRRALGPNAIVELIVAAVVEVRAHPVVAKVLDDERELVGAFLDDLPALLDRATGAVSPLVEAAMARGDLADRDPALVAAWLVRVTATAIVAPPAGDLATFLRELLLPALQPPRRLRR